MPLLYATDGTSGLNVYDLSQPAAPAKVGSWAGRLADVVVVANAAGRRVYAATEYWFVAATAPRIVELDATNLGAISELGRRSPDGRNYASGPTWRLQGMTLAGDRLVVTHSHGGVGVLDRANLAGTPLATSTDLGDTAHAGAEHPTIAPYAMDVEAADDVLVASDATTGVLSTFRVG